MITYNNIIDRFEKFAKDNQFLRSFTHGSPSGVDLDKFELYPTMHVVYTGATYDSTSKEYSFEVYILDLPADKADKIDNQQQMVSNAEQVAEDILADMRNGDNVFDFDHLYSVTSAFTTPLEETTSNSLSGILLTLSIEVGYTYDACNAPLIGVSPTGSAAEGLIGRQSIIELTTNNDTALALGANAINVPAYTNWDNYSFNLNGSASYVSAWALGASSRHEIHGLNARTVVKVEINFTITANAAGTYGVSNSSSGLNLPVSEVYNFTGAGSQTFTIVVEVTNSANAFAYFNLSCLATATGTFRLNTIKFTITDPISG
jgi:hypothetical protein